jgi:hypothetical protein
MMTAPLKMIHQGCVDAVAAARKHRERHQAGKNTPISGVKPMSLPLARDT